DTRVAHLATVDTPRLEPAWPMSLEIHGVGYVQQPAPAVGANVADAVRPRVGVVRRMDLILERTVRVEDLELHAVVDHDRAAVKAEVAVIPVPRHPRRVDATADLARSGPASAEPADRFQRRRQHIDPGAPLIVDDDEAVRRRDARDGRQPCLLTLPVDVRPGVRSRPGHPSARWKARRAPGTRRAQDMRRRWRMCAPRDGATWATQ